MKEKIILCAACAMLCLFAACDGADGTDGGTPSDTPPSAPASESPVDTPTPARAAESTPSPTPTPDPTPPPTPHPASLFKPSSVPETDPGGAINYQHDIQAGGETVAEYLCPDEIFFGLPEYYTSLGVTTFRGDNFRNGPAWGNVSVSEEKLTELYKFSIGYTDKWTGVGWTGQPCIVQWEPDVLAYMNVYPEKKQKDGLVEVINGTMDGKIYFFDLEDGEFTRDPIILGEPIKGAVTVDPRGYPILYVGQGVSYKTRFGYYIYSLIDGQEIYFINGRDPFARRGWGAFDSNPLFDIPNDRMFLCGENGVIYNIKLNTEYDKGVLKIDPQIARYRYNYKPMRQQGIESSPAIFSHYLFVADNSGFVHCVDLMTFTPVWARDCTDDTDSTVVLDWEEDAQSLSLYTACEVDYQGDGGICHIRKLNAANGDLLWEHTYPCLYDENVNGGALATPVSGKGDISDCVIFWIAKLKGYKGGGALVCYNKKTGEVVWENIMPNYGWSSPVAVYTETGKSYIVVCDSAGYMYLIRGTTGEILDRITLGANIEASPAVYGNTVVVGTRGQRIFGIEIS